MKEVLSLKQAILATLTYFGLLDFPLTCDEIEDYLYGWSAPREAIEKELKEIPNIGHAHGYYFLQGRQEIAELRKERSHLGEKLWKKVERFCWLLSLCPFVKMIAVCNSLAYGNVKETSDIDLFIVTENERLWTARFLMKILTQLFAMRVHHDKIAGRFCLSFFVSEKAMNLQSLAHEFDPHLAYFVKTMIPIFGQETYYKFLAANEQWTLPYFKQPLSQRLKKIQHHTIASVFRFLLEKITALCGEEFFYQKQFAKDKVRKRKFPKSEEITMTKDVFKFHEDDPRRKIAEKFAKQKACITATYLLQEKMSEFQSYRRPIKPVLPPNFIF